MKLRVAILTGGESSEREIALLSAQSVASALASFFDVQTFDFPAELDRFIAERQTFAAAVPVFHGKGGEDGTVQGFLKTVGVPFIFSDVAAHAIGMNKWVTKQVVRAAGVQVAPETRELPVVVKPMHGGSSIGVSIAHTEAELEAALKKAHEQENHVLVEKYIAGEEFTVAVIDHAGKTSALPVIKIVPKGHTFFDYETKYAADLVDEICPAPISNELSERLQAVAIKAHKAIGARHLTRSDFIVDAAGEIWFLEINTIPGQTVNSSVPKALRAAGLDFGEVLKGWVESAILAAHGQVDKW